MMIPRSTPPSTHTRAYTSTHVSLLASNPHLRYSRRLWDTILQGIPHVCCYLDDILVTGKDDAKYLQVLEEVFHRLEKHGLRLKREKCSFMEPSMEYLGHWIDATGIHTLPSKLQAIQDAPEPQNVTQLRSFLGLLNYYGKFIGNLSTLIHPLNELLKRDNPWNWTQECAKEALTSSTVLAHFDPKLPETLTSSTVLAHFDPKLPITLAGDASSYGIGAVISLPHPQS